MLATNSTLHEEVGFPSIPVKPRNASTLLLPQSRSVFFFLNLPTGPLLPRLVLSAWRGHPQASSKRETIDHPAESCCIWQNGRTTRDQHLHPLGHRFHLLRKAHEFEYARCLQRSQLLGGLCKSDVQRALGRSFKTDLFMRSSPLSPTWQSQKFLSTTHPLSSAFIHLFCLISIFLT